jgi:hypothetical protein
MRIGSGVGKLILPQTTKNRPDGVFGRGRMGLERRETEQRDEPAQEGLVSPSPAGENGIAAETQISGE